MTLGASKPLPHDAVVALRAILQREDRLRDLALFNVGIDTYLRSCDLVALRVGHVRNPDGHVRGSFTTRQKKTGKLVECRLYAEAQVSIEAYMVQRGGAQSGDALFPGRGGLALTTRRHRYLMEEWKALLRWSGFKLPDGHFSTHSVRKAKVAALYRKEKDIVACMRLLGQTDPDVTIRYLGVGVEEAHELASKHKF